MLTSCLSSVPYRRKAVRYPKDGMTRIFVSLKAPDFSRVRVHYIQGYGYKSIADVERQYGEAANQVIAECIFECLQLIDYDFVSFLYPSESSAESSLRAIEGKPL